MTLWVSKPVATLFPNKRMMVHLYQFVFWYNFCIDSTIKRYYMTHNRMHAMNIASSHVAEAHINPLLLLEVSLINLVEWQYCDRFAESIKLWSQETVVK
jgi:hypothetical protein